MRTVAANSLPLWSRRIALGLAASAIVCPLQFHGQQPLMQQIQLQQVPMHRGQKHESHHQIDRLEEVWRDALVQGNTAAMDSLLADDFMAITPSGTLQTKEQTLASLRSGQLHITAINFSDRKVRFYGTTALVTSLAEVTGTNAEGDITGDYRYTHVYARDAKGKWKIVSFEASRIREAGERK